MIKIQINAAKKETSDVNRPAEASAAFPAGLGRWGLNARRVAKSVKN